MSCSNCFTNNLQNLYKCPACKHSYISGFEQTGISECPSCHNRFMTNKKDHHGSNNVYYKDGCPALMSDGRFITNYGSSNELTENIRKELGFNNTNDFRNYLQNNANLIMDADRTRLQRFNTCNPNVGCSEGWKKIN